MSMIPAFSPGPCNTWRLRVGKRFKCTREDLYEQCSLHITLKMPSSVIVGSRPPSSFLTFSYSSGVRPCWRMRSEEHTSELQSLAYLVCRLLLEKKKTQTTQARQETHPQTHHAQFAGNRARPLVQRTRPEYHVRRPAAPLGGRHTDQTRDREGRT